MPLHEAWWERSSAAWERHIKSFDPKELKEALDLAEDITKAAATGVVTPKTVRSLRRFLQLFLRDLDRLARRNVQFQSLGRNKFMIGSENPGHFLVEFMPIGLTHLGSHAEFHLYPGPTPAEHEEYHSVHLPPAGQAIRGATRAVIEAITGAQHFFELVRDAPEEVAKQVPRFGESPRDFFERRRRETGMPPSTAAERDVLFGGLLGGPD